MVCGLENLDLFRSDFSLRRDQGRDEGTQLDASWWTNGQEGLKTRYLACEMKTAKKMWQKGHKISCSSLNSLLACYC